MLTLKFLQTRSIEVIPLLIYSKISREDWWVRRQGSFFFIIFHSMQVKNRIYSLNVTVDPTCSRCHSLHSHTVRNESISGEFDSSFCYFNWKFNVFCSRHQLSYKPNASPFLQNGLRSMWNILNLFPNNSLTKLNRIFVLFKRTGDWEGRCWGRWWRKSRKRSLGRNGPTFEKEETRKNDRGIISQWS